MASPSCTFPPYWATRLLVDYVVTGAPGCTPYNGLYGEAPPKGGTLFSLEVCNTVGISRVEVQKRDGITVI